MKSQIRVNGTDIHSDFTFMNSNTLHDELTVTFADRKSNDLVKFQMNKIEAEKLRNHLDSYLSS